MSTDERTAMTTEESTMNTDKTTLPEPAPSVWPSVGFTDIDAAIHLLTEVLGFVITAIHRDDDGTVQHAEARRPDGGGVMFGSRGKPGEWGALGATGVYVVAADVAGVEAAWERAQAADDVEVTTPLTQQPYDPATFSVRDRDGNLWSVGTYRGE